MKKLSPIKVILKQKKMTQRDFAVACDLSFPCISDVAAGAYKTLPVKVTQGLKALGYNPEEVQREYNLYRLEERKNIMKGVTV